MANLGRLHANQQQLFRDFVQLRSKYDRSQGRLQELLWGYIPRHVPHFPSLPPIGHDEEVSEETGDSAQHVGPYALGEPLGDGHSAVVRCCSLRSGKAPPLLPGEGGRGLAVKVVNKARITDVVTLKRLSSEIQALESLSTYPHRNLLPLLDVIHTRRHVYLVTPRGGGDLFE